MPYKSPQTLTELEMLTVQFSNEFGDSQNIKSNLTQSKHIEQEARKKGIDQQIVLEFMRKLRGDIQLDYSPEINGSKMGYFYKALRYNLHLADKQRKPMLLSP